MEIFLAAGRIGVHIGLFYFDFISEFVFGERFFM